MDVLSPQVVRRVVGLVLGRRVTTAERCIGVGGAASWRVTYREGRRSVLAVIDDTLVRDTRNDLMALGDSLRRAA
ncbi:MAG: hypothetical protein HYX33_04045 [Actinobacteria bacterium]|nr:hypothetical protein [Actinomycetota bacterium]